MRRLLAGFAVAGLALPFGALQSSTETEFTLTGVVVHDDGSPAADAFVSVGKLRIGTHTDAGGAFSLTGPAGVIETVTLDAVSVLDDVTQLAAVDVPGATTSGEVDLGTISLESTCAGFGIVGSIFDVRAASIDWQNDVAVAVGIRDFTVLDISDGSSPTFVERLVFPTRVTDVVIDGNYAFVAASESSFQVVEGVLSGGLSIVATVGTGDWTRNLARLDDEHIVAFDASGVTVVNVSDPTAPVPYGTVVDGDFRRRGTTDGDLIYAVTWDVSTTDGALVIVDASDPTSTSVLGSVRVPGSAEAVAIDGGVAFIADGSAGLTIVDVSDPGAPAILATLPEARSTDIAVENGFAFLTPQSNLTPGLLCVDVSDPSTPRVQTSLGTVAPDCIAMSGGRAWIGDDSGPVRHVDLRDRVAWSLSSAAAADQLSDFAIEGSLAIAIDYPNDLVVFDVSDLANPTRVSEHAITENALDIALQDGIAYVLGWTGLEVVDFGDPMSPVTVGSMPTLGPNPSAVAVDGSFAYLADTDFRVVDVSDPTAPTIVRSIELSSFAIDIAVQSGVAYVAHNALSTIDVSDPTNAMLVTERPGSASSVAVFDETLLVEDFFLKTVIYDLSIPTAPVEITSVDVGTEFAVHEDAFVGIDFSSALLIDISDRANPVVERSLGLFGTASNVGGIALTADAVFTSVNDRLQVNDRGCFGVDPGTVSTPEPVAEGFGLRVVGANPSAFGVAFELDLPRPARATASIHDVRGRRVWSASAGVDRGPRTFTWDGVGSDGVRVSPGVYFLRVDVPGASVTRKVTLLP